MENNDLNIKWYKIEPIDTLFFKTAEPMDIGETHSANLIFPPTPNTIRGAFRTLVLKENKISIKDYYSNKIDEKILNTIGSSEEETPFEIIGPFFLKDGKFYIPTPYLWYKSKIKTAEDDNLKDDILIPKKIELKNIKYISSEINDNLLWVEDENIKSLGGNYIDIETFKKLNTIDKSKNSKYELKSIEYFVEQENRIGIARDSKARIVRESHIYSFPHIRLKKYTSLIIGLTKNLQIEKNGIIELGAEKRKAYYSEIIDFAKEWEDLTKIKGEYFMSLTIVEGNEIANRNIISTGKIQYIGGWNLKKRFHKPLKGYYPQGTVFSQNINSICIPITI